MTPIILGKVSLEDELLALRVTAGDDLALGELFDRHGSLLLGIAKQVTCNHILAQDVLQEVLVEFWRNPGRFDASRGSLRSFLAVQVHRRAIDALRSRSRRKAREERWESQTVAVRDEWSSEVDEVEVNRVVSDAIGRLPDDQRKVVELAYWKGYTHIEVARALDIPEGTVKSRLRLARTKLAEWLAPIATEI
jgi:RNA polymerase sigma-70 factor, ECF subfamily